MARREDGKWSQWLLEWRPKDEKTTANNDGMTWLNSVTQ